MSGIAKTGGQESGEGDRPLKPLRGKIEMIELAGFMAMAEQQHLIGQSLASR
jgi:hypothetical protein